MNIIGILTVKEVENEYIENRKKWCDEHGKTCNGCEEIVCEKNPKFGKETK